MKENIEYKNIYNNELKKEVPHYYDPETGEWEISVRARMNDTSLLLSMTPVKDEDQPQ